jgi:N-acylneuraminate cytidylyltransferase
MEQDGIWVKSLEKGELILRRQEKPILWGRNGAAIYITRIDKLSEYIFGGNILPYEMVKSQSIDIDDLEDWIMAEAILKYKMDNNQS